MKIYLEIVKRETSVVSNYCIQPVIHASRITMLSSEQNPEECDATGDAMKNWSWANARHPADKKISNQRYAHYFLQC
ncbi:MAG: hypothetical protein WDN26_07065 [Chitinophagaceae bacterium]